MPLDVHHHGLGRERLPQLGSVLVRVRGRGRGRGRGRVWVWVWVWVRVGVRARVRVPQLRGVLAREA